MQITRTRTVFQKLIVQDEPVQGTGVELDGNHREPGLVPYFGKENAIETIQNGLTLKGSRQRHDLSACIHLVIGYDQDLRFVVHFAEKHIASEI